MNKRRFFVDIDLDKNEIKNVILDNIASESFLTEEGQIGYDGTDGKVKIYTSSGVESFTFESSKNDYNIAEIDISGASPSIDLSKASFFKITITSNVTDLTFTNEVVGRQYIFMFIKNTTEKTLTWQAGKYYFPFGNAPVLTNPTTNGSSPAKSEDIITALCRESGRLDLVFTPNMLPN